MTFGWEGRNSSCFSQTETSALPGFQVGQSSDWNYTVGSPRSPACHLILQSLGSAHFHNCMNQFLIINTHIHTHAPYWLFLCRTPIEQKKNCHPFSLTFTSSNTGHSMWFLFLEGSLFLVLPSHSSLSLNVSFCTNILWKLLPLVVCQWFSHSRFCDFQNIYHSQWVMTSMIDLFLPHSSGRPEHHAWALRCTPGL